MDQEREPSALEPQRIATREAYDRLARVWSATTDDGPWNGWLERPALRSAIPWPLRGATVLDAGCGSGAQCEWLADQGAQVIGLDLSPEMIAQAQQRCGTGCASWSPTSVNRSSSSPAPWTE